MSDPKPFDPFDPISAAMGAMHGQNLIAAKDARIKQLEAELKEMTDLQKETQEDRNAVTQSYWEIRDKMQTLEDLTNQDEVCKFFLRKKNEEVNAMKARLKGMREAGDQLWYCVRHAQRIHADELIDAIEEWQEARNHG
jgi:septal ring factor EnvC (AmiA/AmiB activator)